MGLSAHLRREGFCALSVKMASPVERRREAIAESFLSVKASPRGKTHSVRVTPLSVMGLNPVVAVAQVCLCVSSYCACTRLCMD
jgi:hypothetical protein